MKSWKRTCLVLLTAGFTTAIAHSTLSPLFPAYIRSVGGSIAEIGIFFTASTDQLSHIHENIKHELVNFRFASVEDVLLFTIPNQC